MVREFLQHPKGQSCMTRGELVSLRDHLNFKLEAQEKLFNTQLTDMEKAVGKAKENMEQRMDGFPAQFVKKGEVEAALGKMEAKMDDLTRVKSEYILRGEYNIEHKSLSDKVSSLETKASNAVTRSEMLAAVTVISSVLAGLIMLFHHLMGGK